MRSRGANIRAMLSKRRRVLRDPKECGGVVSKRSLTRGVPLVVAGVVAILVALWAPWMMWRQPAGHGGVTFQEVVTHTAALSLTPAGRDCATIRRTDGSHVLLAYRGRDLDLHRYPDPSALGGEEAQRLLDLCDVSSVVFRGWERTVAVVRNARVTIESSHVTVATDEATRRITAAPGMRLDSLWVACIDSVCYFPCRYRSVCSIGPGEATLTETPLSYDVLSLHAIGGELVCTTSHSVVWLTRDGVRREIATGDCWPNRLHEVHDANGPLVDCGGSSSMMTLSEGRAAPLWVGDSADRTGAMRYGRRCIITYSTLMEALVLRFGDAYEEHIALFSQPMENTFESGQLYAPHGVIGLGPSTEVFVQTDALYRLSLPPELETICDRGSHQ